MKTINKSAVFSSCRKYRYSLTRSWNSADGYVLFIGLNPSIADEMVDDPTLKRCINFAKDWGYGGLIMVNLFAYMATYPSELKKATLPIGKENNKHILNGYQKSQLTVIAWGNDGYLLGRDKEVLAIIENPMCLNINKSGQPAHPLYQKKSQELINFNH
jgi:hypothetical protein|tara:strand:+ start:266 stop:742 length:477 start_codon:yes stop_codon:yes gene_type:complete